MDFHLLVCLKVERTKFQQERYVGEDDVLALVESGSFEFDDGTGMKTVGPLDAVNFKKGRVYQRHILEPAAFYLCRYRADSSLFGQGKVVFRDKDRIRSTLELLRVADRDIYLDHFECKRALFLDLITQYRLENIRNLEDSLQQDPAVADAVEYINAQLHHKVDLSGLAQKHFLSYVQFARRFKQTIGMTPQEYLTAIRMKKAKMMLAETDLQVKKIARDCGFGNEYYFSNYFKQYHQMSPKEYRVMIKSSSQA